MKASGNTILITGGGSGIGKGLAQALHNAGNQVIISGRRKEALDAMVAENPGMAAFTVDMTDPASIEALAAQVLERFPGLDAVLHNAGIMQAENLRAAQIDLKTPEDTIATNLLGPIRLNAALLPHLLAQASATVLTVSSGLAFVPMAATPTYSATKAAIHSYSMALRQQLKGTSVQVIEIAPPYVQTHLMGERQANDTTAMPLDAFLAEVMQILTEHPEREEVIVSRCEPLRYAAERGNFDVVFERVNNLVR